MTESRSIVIEETLPHSVRKVWKALTTAEFISAWLMETDFVPEVGRSFTFRAKPMGDWDGVVYCKVTECESQTRLSYAWQGGKDAGRLDTVVTWDLTAVEGGTRLRMEQSGFVSPGNDMAFSMMAPGWGQILQRLSGVLEGLGD